MSYRSESVLLVSRPGSAAGDGGKHRAVDDRLRPPSPLPLPPALRRTGTEVALRPGGRRRPDSFKRLIVCADGTWLNSDNGMTNGELSIPSNVTRISRAIRPVSRDGVPQIVYYHFGVGSQGGLVDRIVSGTTGEGLGGTVREAYSFLSTNYSPGDEIFLIGFSRGAFTARSVAGLIDAVGLLTKKGLSALPEVFKDVQHRKDPKYKPKNPDVPFPDKPSADDPEYLDELLRRGMTDIDVTIKAIGVWDTVGSLGLPRLGWFNQVGAQQAETKKMSFYDTTLSNCIENAFQALALDEKRAAFSPAVWEKKKGNKTTLRQVWFPGVHSNVGGGYDDQELANITLAWMMSQLDPFLDINRDYILAQDEENIEYYHRKHKPVRPWSFGKIYNSMTGIYALGGGLTRSPGRYYAVDPDTGKPTNRPLRDTHEYIHPSVRTRIKLHGPGVDDKDEFTPAAMDEWKLVVEYPDGERRPPHVFWKLKSRDHNVSTRVLPESPLWGLEKELLMQGDDEELEESVLRPPPTGSSGRRKTRKSRRVSFDEVEDRRRASWGGYERREVER